MRSKLFGWLGNLTVAHRVYGLAGGLILANLLVVTVVVWQLGRVTMSQVQTASDESGPPSSKVLNAARPVAGQ